jgi:transaldolase
VATSTTTHTRLHDLQAQGQSVWYDNIRRGLITSGELQQLIDDGVVGITSNPTIFEKAMAEGSDYDDDLERLAKAGKDARQVFEVLSLADIGNAADMLRGVYDKTNALDGYVSIEVSPVLAHDTEATIKEARHLWSSLNRPNIMIKVPATPEGIPAIETLIGEGINVNVTMLFALDNYREVADAYLKGLEARAGRGEALDRVASVASIFVSRIDTAIDGQLDQKIKATDDQAEQSKLRALQGKAAIANAKATYAVYQEIYASDRFAALKAKGARPQRLLWASTSTKNPAFPDLMYVEALVGPDTVDTMPPATVTAFMDHGTAKPTLTEGLDEAPRTLEALGDVGIDVPATMQKLQDDGVASFAKSFETMIGAIQKKVEALR